VSLHTERPEPTEGVSKEERAECSLYLSWSSSSRSESGSCRRDEARVWRGMFAGRLALYEGTLTDGGGDCWEQQPLV
jgi:hypothetical protein